MFFIFIYSYAATYSTNCAFDYSSPKIFKSEIVDKRISRGRHTKYYIKVAPLGHHLDRESKLILKKDYWEYHGFMLGNNKKLLM